MSQTTIYIYLSFIFFLTYGKNIIADSFDITPNVYYFNYEEFSQSNKSLNKEDGFLPGLKLRYTTLLDKHQFSAYTSLHYGTVDYRGQTQGGQPLNTRTDEKIIQLGFEFKSEQLDQIPASIIMGIRHWEWDREIQGLENVIGLHELYTWNEASIGLHIQSEAKNNVHYWSNLSALYTISPDMEIFLPNSSLTLNLEGRPGFRFNAGASWNHNTQQLIKLSFIAEYWAFGRSNTVFTNDFFGNAAFLTEPRSESIHTGIELTYSYQF